MRIFSVGPEQFREIEALPEVLPEPVQPMAGSPAAEGFVWAALRRSELSDQIEVLQRFLERWGGRPLVDLHVSDLLNDHLPSHFDSTSWYDLMVFRRLGALPAAGEGGSGVTERRALDAVDTSPVGFAVYDRVLVTIHPEDAAEMEHFARRLAMPRVPQDWRGSRLPASPADLMLRMVNHSVDSYLDLRRLLTRDLNALQRQLLDPRHPFTDWQSLLESRNALHALEDICEDQRSAVQEWIDALDEWPLADEPAQHHDRDLLRVRSRDVLEHIARVLSHVRRLEQSAETAVQMHFSALSHRTNHIMRTLTVLTAVFLPLNLIAGFFGMNFEFLPLIHSSLGFWVVCGLMLGVGVALILFFRRKRYLG